MVYFAEGGRPLEVGVGRYLAHFGFSGMYFINDTPDWFVGEPIDPILSEGKFNEYARYFRIDSGYFVDIVAVGILMVRGNCAWLAANYIDGNTKPLYEVDFVSVTPGFVLQYPKKIPHNVTLEELTDQVIESAWDRVCARRGKYVKDLDFSNLGIKEKPEGISEDEMKACELAEAAWLKDRCDEWKPYLNDLNLLKKFGISWATEEESEADTIESEADSLEAEVDVIESEAEAHNMEQEDEHTWDMGHVKACLQNCGAANCNCDTGKA